MTCHWCGDEHDVTALCQRAQRGMTRRSFLFLTAAGVAGAVLAPQLPEYQWREYGATFTVHPNVSKLVAEEWNRLIGAQLAGDMFIDQHFGKLLANSIKQRRLKEQS